MEIQKLVELISNGLAVPTLFCCVIVLSLWKDSVIQIIKTKDLSSPQHWFILGVFIAFLGEFLDNTFWTIAWVAIYLELPQQHGITLIGAWSNIPFRQLMVICAAYCHAHSAILYLQDKEHLHRLHTSIIISFLWGGMAIGVLYFLSRVI